MSRAPGTPYEVSAIDLELLEEIEGQALNDLRQLRRHERHESKLRATFEELEREGHPLGAGYTRNLSMSGCRMLLPVAPRVGDVFRVVLDDPRDGEVPVRGRCLRCVLLREGVFDTAWEFLDALPMDLPDDDDDLRRPRWPLRE